ncbi:hypothetical protein [Parahaliea mediterranea]|nr:hypothetical protein [Parahaliea mediterranea]
MPLLSLYRCDLCRAMLSELRRSVADGGAYDNVVMRALARD